MTRKEFRWLIIYSLILAAITSLPYLTGYSFEGDDWKFTGFVFGVNDGNSYIAKMLRGSTGDWLFRTPYTTMEQRGVLAFLPYLLLGKLASGDAIHEQFVALFHIFRILSIPLVVIATYKFTSLFIKENGWRKWVTVLATIGGGLGWLIVVLGMGEIFGSLSPDWISPEWFGFLAVYGLPHLTLARALLLLGVWAYLSSPVDRRRAWLAGFFFLCLGLVHPLSLVTAFAAIGVHQVAVWIAAGLRKSWFIAKGWLRSALLTVIIPLPLVIYLGYSFTTDPFLKVWTTQNRIISPHPIHVLVAFGLLIVPAILGIPRILQVRRWSGLLLIGWLAAFPFFAYGSPILQRRLPEGIWIVWLIMAAIGLSHPWGREYDKGSLWGKIILGLTLPTSILLLIGGLQVASKPSEPVFRSPSEVVVFEWIRENGKPDDIVLASFSTGNALPAWAPVRVLVGHGPESANLKDVLTDVEGFFSGQWGVEEQLSYVETHQINYVLVGPTERSLDQVGFEPAAILELILEVEDYQLYRVNIP
ncbi:MAG: hypothetical protein GTO18_11695 [Anaerolineales bacterium]|nr:hypothetical protein [Anaerolineales bacterium]